MGSFHCLCLTFCDACICHSPDFFAFCSNNNDSTDGMEAARVLQKELTASPPVIGITADVTPGIKERFLSSGAVCVLKKPIDMDQVINIVLQYAQQ